MIEHQLETTVRQPAERAFDFFVDFRNEPAWNPVCLRVEKTTPGPIDVGTKFTGEMKRMGENESEIVTFERPSRISAVERGRGAEGTFDYRFTPTKGGTHISVVMRMQPRGPMRLLEPLMGRMLKRMLADLPEKMRDGIDAADRVREQATA